MSDNKTVVLPALVAIGCAQRLMEVSSVAIVAWLALGYFNAWAAWSNGGLGAALVGFGASVVCLVLAWGHWRTRQEAKRLRDMLAKQAGLL